MLNASNEIIDSKVRMYVERSAEAACKRVWYLMALQCSMGIPDFKTFDIVA